MKTLNSKIDKSATKEDLGNAVQDVISNSNANCQRILKSIDDLSDVVKEGFVGIEKSLIRVAAEACMGNKECETAIDGLQKTLIGLREEGLWDIDEIKKIMNSLGGKFSDEMKEFVNSVSVVGGGGGNSTERR